MATKNSVNTNFARAVSDPLNAPLKNEQDGTEPLTDLRGVLYVNTSGSPPPPPLTIPTYPNGKEYGRYADITFATIYNAGPADLFELYGFKTQSNLQQYIQLFDALALPVNGTTPKISIPISTINTIFSLSNPVFYIPTIPGSPMFGTGIVIALSTAATSLAISATPGIFVTYYIGKY